jgi:hypothetical protein
LKASNFHYKRALLLLTALAVFVGAPGCSDDESTSGVDEGELAISMIILNPKSAEPGDTVQATVDVDGWLPTGTYPTYRWSSEGGGTFLTDNQQSVGWVAPKPTISSVVRLTCTVTYAGGSASHSAEVFVGTPEEVVPYRAGEIHLIPSGGFYYLYGRPGESGWDSSQVYMFDGASTPVSNSLSRGAEFVFTGGPGTEPTHAAFTSVDSTDITFSENAINVWLTDLATGVQGPITRDESIAGGSRRHQYRYPYFSPNGGWVTFQGFHPHPQAGAIDTMGVFAYDLNTEITLYVTAKDSVRERPMNYYPTYSSDGNWLVYVSDRDQRDVWELYGIPATDGAPDDQADPTRLTNDGGLIGVTTPTSLTRPKMAWNPNPARPTLAVVGSQGSDKYIHLVTTSGSGATSERLTDIGRDIIEFVWSNDGTVLAVSALTVMQDGSTKNGLFLVDPGAASSNLWHTGTTSGDRIYDLTWSPDGSFLVYRTVRDGNDSWFELIDIDGGTSYLGPIVLSASIAVGNRGSYAAAMSTRPAYDATNVVYGLIFDGPSPAIGTLNITGTVR